MADHALDGIEAVAGATLMTYTWRRYFQLAVAAIGLAAVLVQLTALAYVYNVRVDLSPGNRFTLSDHALRVLRTIEEPVQITAFIRTEDPRNPYIKDLLWQSARESEKLSYDVVDLNRSPALATRYGIDAYGAVVVESAGRRADFTSPSEVQLMGALLTVRESRRKVYMLTGHGECALLNTDRHVGCSQMRDALSLESYDVQEMGLLGGRRVPADADVVVIAGPRRDLLEEEAAELDAWLSAGGKMVVLLDPFRAPHLVSLLGRYGVRVSASVAVDPDNRLAGGEALSIAVAERDRRHLITGTLEARPLFSAAAPVTASDREEIGRRHVSLLRTGPRSWASFDPAILEGAVPKFLAGRDRNGPLSLGVQVTEPARALGPDADRDTRIVVYGDSDFARNRFLDYLGNRDLLVNTVNWLARADDLMGSRPQRKEGGKNQFFISNADERTMFWSAVVIQPGLFLALAVFLLIRRKVAP